MLEKQTLELLEFEPIRNSIASYAKSAAGAELIRSQGFETEFDKLEYNKNIVSDWKTLLMSDFKQPDFFFPDINYVSDLRVEGTVLEGIQLSDIAVFITSAAKMRKYCQKKPDNTPMIGILETEALQLPELEDYSRAILKELNPDGSVKDNHPLLKAARAKIASLHGRITKASAGYFNDNTEIWQSTVATQRDGRIVLPLKANYRGRVKGIINEVSSSGATVFVEPFEMVELNNEMAFEQNQLKQQVFRIYKNLTEHIRECFEELVRMELQVAFLDSWYSRAVYSIRNKCIRPENCDKGIIINKGRHPLLGNAAVPISLSYNDAINILIITGPNAGGKTVTLKTCGLFVLMNQFACELPAEEGTVIGLYEKIFADIGDDQSIEQSLSTFSGHMRRISNVLSNADIKSLVLLDELGSGTDPSQGSAIAMGILQYLLRNKISTIITSHHSAVKNFGYTNKGAVNASVAFDSETMKPTYEIIEGVPGESHAVEIAEAMGLPEEVIDLAESYLQNDDTTVSGMIKELERRQHDIMEREKQFSENEIIQKEDRRKLDLEKLKLKQQKYEIDSKDYSRLKGFIEESRKELENLVRELREGEITREKNKKVKEHIKKLDQKLNAEKSRLNDEEQNIISSGSKRSVDREDAVLFETGVEVLYRKNKRKGVLVEKRKKNIWLVAFGNIKLPINESELLPVKNRKKDSENPVVSKRFNVSAQFELDLRGMRAYEAEEALIRQIDAALLSGLNEFSIIHGLGEGILQQIVQDFLQGSENVRDFSYSDPEQGGFGKTVVRLK